MPICTCISFCTQNGYISSLLQSKEVYKNVQFSKSNIPIILSGYMMYVTPLNIEIVERTKVTFRQIFRYENIKTPRRYC